MDFFPSNPWCQEEGNLLNDRLTMTLCRYDSVTAGMRIVSSPPVLDNAWPLTMAWSSWTVTADGTATIQVAVGGSSGGVAILRIKILAGGGVEVVQEPAVSPESRKTVTAMQWLEEHDGKRTLAIGRLGEVVLWTKPTTLNELDPTLVANNLEKQTFSIPMGTFRGWPSIPTPIGFLDVPSSDSLTISMTDGTYRTITSLSFPSPRLHPLTKIVKQDSNPSLELSESVQSSFMALEKAGAAKKLASSIPATSAMAVSGFEGLDRTGTVLWAYERQILDCKVYSMANLHKTTIVLGRLFEDDLARKTLEELNFIGLPLV